MELGAPPTIEQAPEPDAAARDALQATPAWERLATSTPRSWGASRALIVVIAREWQNVSNRDRISHPILEALFIVGFASLAQAALDAPERRAA